MWVEYNDNPIDKNTGDCVLRALAVATGDGWNATYWGLCLAGSYHFDWGNSDEVWWDYLDSIGWKRHFLPDHCPMCYTLKDFCREYPNGVYIVGMKGHVVAVVDGNYIDSWDSGKCRPLYFWRKDD